MGIVFNIQRFCTQDGPGIRTTVFLKGCPLRCGWCHNPESQRLAPEQFSDGEICGKDLTADAVLEEVLRDREFYADTGGMTLSGGEPLLQRAFSLELLEKAKNAGLHTAVETCGYVENIEEFLPFVDLWLYDLKLFDEAQHIAHTGVSNHLILENLEKLGQHVIIRGPVIEGINLNRQHFEALASLKRPVQLLPYHPLGIEKAKRLGRTQAYCQPEFLAKEKILPLIEGLENIQIL